MERKASVKLTPERGRRVRLCGDHKINEVVMAKVIEFYLRKNFRKPLKGAPLLQYGKVIEFYSQTKKSA